VLPEADPLFPSEATVETFDAQMRLLKSVFNVLPLPEAVARLQAGTLPARLTQGRLESRRPQAPQRQFVARADLSQLGRFRHPPSQLSQQLNEAPFI